MSHRSQPTPRVSAFSTPAASLFPRILLYSIVLLAFFSARLAVAQIDTNSIAPHRYLVLYHNASIPTDAESRVAHAGAGVRLT